MAGVLVRVSKIWGRRRFGFLLRRGDLLCRLRRGALFDPEEALIFSHPSTVLPG
jgi:hypothetical protein